VQRSIATVSLGGGLPEKLYAAAAAKFAMVEITESDLTFNDMSPAELRALLHELGMSVSLFHALPDCEGVSDALFRNTLQRAELKFQLMSELGASLLLVPSNCAQHAIDDDSLVAAQLRELAEQAARHGISIGYEAVAKARHIRSYSDAWRVVEKASHPHLGLVVDSFETFASGQDPCGIAAIPGKRILMVQLADAPADGESMSHYLRCFPGQGVLDVLKFAENVLDSGYAGPFSLEVLNDGFRAAPVRQIAVDGMRSLTLLEEQLYRSGRSAQPSLFEETAPPAMPADESVGFIEFAVDTRGQAALDAWLTSMGFARAGRHRTKDVTLYRQGDVLIVLNAGTDTFAHYYHHLHGASVCAIGLRTSDPSVLLARAELYSYKRYEERIGPQEYRMPAVRAPDGSLVHLLDENYDPAMDFVLDDNVVDTTVGIERVDHIARAVPSGQFDSWVLFYRALLGLQPDTALNLADPHGAVSSRALHDLNNRLRLPLTFSENDRTVVARSVSSYGGAGVNQIAFETSDIFTAVASMRRNGVRLLRIPANYYRELKAVRDLSDELVAKLQDADILYDADARGGQFFHAYTEFFDGRIFFEVVQRVGGYHRYGESNAPVRMAAQAKQGMTRRAT
jgi:4-hydroxyphenylpyruvate dioxygenase